MLDLTSTRVLARAGLLAPARPDRLLGMGLAMARWGVTPAAGYAAGAARHPHRVALVDDEGSLTWREVDELSAAAAAELTARGVADGDAVGVLARNGRGFVLTMGALAKCGADLLYLNTAVAATQLEQVLQRESAVGVVADADLVEQLGAEGGRWLLATTEELASAAPPPRALRTPTHTSRQVILTSGTTGAPRGAARQGASMQDAVAALSRIPLRSGETTVIAAPMFHAWGLGHLSLALLLGSTVVTQRRFDPERLLALVQEHQASALVVVPVMLDRLLAARPERFDLSSLRVVASSGSSLAPDLVTRVLEEIGPVLYNLYGSTEVAYAAVANPEDLAADPGTAGRPPHGVRLRVVDDLGEDVAPGTPGRIFVGSTLAFEGYTDGSDRDRLDGLIATGDLGLIDDAGRLRVLGRDDDMVVVGGENVFLGQVEDALRAHPAVADAAVVAKDDASYGARLVAHVVLSGSVEPDELKKWVAGRVARFAAPRDVVVHEELPRNATGKVVKRSLGQT